MPILLNLCKIMNEDGCLIVFLAVACLLSTIANCLGSKTINSLKEQNSELKAKYTVVCGSLNDCCRNMMDTYNLPDSIYNHYLDVIEERGYNKLEVKHSYFCY